jgi:hypothetical protein
MPSCTAWAKLQGRAIHPHISSKGSSGAGGVITRTDSLAQITNCLSKRCWLISLIPAYIQASNSQNTEPPL